MWDKTRKVYQMNGIIVTKQLAQSFVSLASIKDFKLFLDAVEIDWSKDGINWREMSDIAKDLMAIYDYLPTEFDVEKYGAAQMVKWAGERQGRID